MGWQVVRLVSMAWLRAWHGYRHGMAWHGMAWQRRLLRAPPAFLPRACPLHRATAGPITKVAIHVLSWYRPVDGSIISSPPALCSSLCTPPEDQTLPGGPSAAAARHKQQRTSSTRRQRDESVSVIRFWRTWHPVQLCRTPIATLTISVHLSRSHESAPVRLPHAALRNGIRCWPRRLAVPPGLAEQSCHEHLARPNASPCLSHAKRKSATRPSLQRKAFPVEISDLVLLLLLLPLIVRHCQALPGIARPALRSISGAWLRPRYFRVMRRK